MHDTKMMFAKFYLHVGQLQFYMHLAMLSSRTGTVMHAMCNKVPHIHLVVVCTYVHDR